MKPDHCLILAAFAAVATGGCSDGRTPAPVPPRTSLIAAALPHRLSEIGLFADLRQLEPAAEVIAYEVRHPLWSDGALKRRHAWFPPGASLAVTADGGFTFPTGSVFAKTFEHPAPGGRSGRIETRILWKSPEGWEMGAYVWNAAGDEAESAGGREVDLPFALPGGDEDYVVPGRASCLQCHAQTGDVVAGFVPWQLDDGALGTLRERGLLPAGSEPLPHRAIDGSCDVERAALGYLAGNCSHCHNDRTAGIVAGGLDLRHHRARTSLVGVRSERLRGEGAVHRVEPGRPERSVLWRLFTNTLSPGGRGGARMPPVGTSIVDPAGAEVLRAWIDSLDGPGIVSEPPRAGG